MKGVVADHEISQQPVDRRQLRRQATIEEIVEVSLSIMAVEGVGGLSVAAVARELRMRPPSVYKYFGSLIDIYDALFRRGQVQNLDVLIGAVDGAEPGLAAVTAGLEATGRWAVAHPVLAELLFWRPVPGYRPSAEAFAPTVEIVRILRHELDNAALAGELAPAAASDDGMALLSTLHFGIISQHLANDPTSDWEHGRFTRLFPSVLALFVQAYPPEGLRPTPQHSHPRLTKPT